MNAMPPSIHYLALGDSYTIGEAVAADRRWPAVLRLVLGGSLAMIVTYAIGRLVGATGL